MLTFKAYISFLSCVFPLHNSTTLELRLWALAYRNTYIIHVWTHLQHTPYTWLRYLVWHLISLCPLAFPPGNLITCPEGRGSWKPVISSHWARFLARPHTEASGFMPAGISSLPFSYLFIIGDYFLLHLWHKQAKKII